MAKLFARHINDLRISRPKLVSTMVNHTKWSQEVNRFVEGNIVSLYVHIVTVSIYLHSQKYKSKIEPPSR